MKGQGTVRLKGDGDRLHLKAQYQLPSSLGTIAGNATVKLVFDPQKSIRPVVETLQVGPLGLPEIFYRRLVDEKNHPQPDSGLAAGDRHPFHPDFWAQACDQSEFIQRIVVKISFLCFDLSDNSLGRAALPGPDTGQPSYGRACGAFETRKYLVPLTGSGPSHPKPFRGNGIPVLFRSFAR